MNAKDPAEELVDCDLALQQRPNDLEALGLRGFLLLQLGRFTDALSDLDRGLELRPDDATTLYNRGICLTRLRAEEHAVGGSRRSWQERVRAARKNFRLALKLRPDDADVHCALGITTFYLDSDKACDDFTRALELDPTHIAALNNRGVYLDHYLDASEEALADFNRALELRPDDPDLLYNRGCVFMDLHRFEDAQIDINRSLELSPHVGLGSALRHPEPRRPQIG